MATGAHEGNQERGQKNRESLPWLFAREYQGHGHGRDNNKWQSIRRPRSHACLVSVGDGDGQRHGENSGVQSRRIGAHSAGGSGRSAGAGKADLSAKAPGLLQSKLISGRLSGRYGLRSVADNTKGTNSHHG